LESIPFINAMPAGASRRIDVLWKDSVLYVADRSPAKMAKAVAQELGRVFGRIEIIDAIKLCYERSSEFITEYLEENFKLNSAEIVENAAKEASAKFQATGAGASSEGAGKNDEKQESTPEASKEPTVEADDVPGEDEDFVEEHPEEHDEGDSDKPRRKQIKPPKASLIERFAKMKGYSKDGDDRYFRSDGSFIAKANGMRFPWELRCASGELLQCYWLKEHCIQKDPLELGAEIWNLCDKFPQKYSLVLSDETGEPLEISGNKLREMCDRDEITLHAATYRLVYERS